MASPTHVVLRPFDGPEGRIKPGRQIAADSWKNVRSLENLRYIRPLGPADVLKAGKSKGD